MGAAVSGPVLAGLAPSYFDETENVRTVFPSALCEIIDNSIAATSPKYPQFSIDLYIRPGPAGQLETTVADAGTGISRTHVADGLFVLGQRRLGGVGPYVALNEHGFGLKNALPWLTKQSGKQFDLRTAFDPGPGGPIEYTRVNTALAVFGMNWTASNVAEFNAWLKPRGPNKATGTRLRFNCARDQAFAGWEPSFGISGKGLSLQEFYDILDEHLGVTYRNFLSPGPGKTPANSIRTHYWDDAGKPFRWREVAPVSIPFDQKKVKTDVIPVHARGASIVVRYTRGYGNPRRASQLKAFYNPAKSGWRAQGFDVVVNGKVVESRVYESIWTTVRNPATNGLVGEIVVQSGQLPTLVTKDGLDWGSPLMLELVRRIRNLDKSPGVLLNSFLPRPPPPPPKPRQWKENELRDLLYSAMKAVAPAGAKVEKNDPAWDNAKTGIDPATAEDLTYEDSRGLFLIEAKINDAKPQHLYQLRMYWDGFAFSRAGVAVGPTRGFLIADTEPKGIRWLRQFLETQEDPNSNPYVLRFRTWKEFGLPPKSPGGKANLAKVRRFLNSIDTCR